MEKKARKAEAKHSTKPKSDKPASRPPTSSTDQGKSTTSSTNTKIADLDKKWSDRFNRLEALLLAKTLYPPRDPVFSTVKVTPSHAPPTNVVRTDPFLKPASQPSQPTDPAVESPATDSSHHKSGVKASSSAQLDPPMSVTVQRQLSTAFDVSRKESLSSSDSDSDSLSSDRPPWIFYWKKANCRTIRKLICLIRNNLCSKNNLTEKPCRGSDLIWVRITYQTLISVLLPQRITRSRALSCTHRARPLSTYRPMNCCVKRWPN